MPEGPLNSLDRFRKRSGRLVLEETSAGCGGMVFRWRNPQAAVPLIAGAYAPVLVKFFLDGVEIQNTHLDVAPGQHQVALALDEIDLGGGLFMFAAWHEANPGYPSTVPPGLKELNMRVVSATDGTWLASLDEPPSDWLGPGFDDSHWQTLTHSRPNPKPNWRETGAHMANWCNYQKAVFLALFPAGRGSRKAGRGRVWVRKRLDVPGPQPA
jgi:hypothetical protein